MNLYAWATPAFVQGSPVDHTWVTSYDSRGISLLDIESVIAANESYWYSWGKFHPKGQMILDATSTSASLCLVPPNSIKSRGTVSWYGIHGVCHQVSNQVLYPSGRTVAGVRGYRASTAIFNTYGRREQAWNTARISCSVAPPSIIQSRSWSTVSLLKRRAVQILGSGDVRVVELDRERTSLTEDLEQIGLAAKEPDENEVVRAQRLNRRIQEFFATAGKILLRDNGHFLQLFGVELDVEINLVDPELFRFPEDSR